MIDRHNLIVYCQPFSQNRSQRVRKDHYSGVLASSEKEARLSLVTMYNAKRKRVIVIVNRGR